MKKVLIIDRQTPETLADELRQLRPWWDIAIVEDHSVALQMITEVQASFDLVIINVGRVPCKLDAIALLLLLRLSGQFEKTRFLALLQYPWDERDNTAALAAGAHMVEAYPQRMEHTERITLKLALRALYEIFRGPQQSLEMYYRLDISSLPQQ